MYIGGVIVGVGVGMLASFSIGSNGGRFVIGLACLLIGHMVASFRKVRSQDHDDKHKIEPRHMA